MIKAVIFDIDGTITTGSKLTEGINYTIERLICLGIKVALYTNDSALDGIVRHRKLGALRSLIPQNRVYTAGGICLKYAKEKCLSPVIAMTPSSLPSRSALAKAGALVPLGFFQQISPKALHILYTAMNNRLPVLFPQKNRLFTDGKTRTFDFGLWVAGLEFCTNQKALVLGKPHPFGYKIICRELGVGAKEALFIGDNHEVDIIGARRAGLKTCLFSTVQNPRFETRTLVSLTWRNIRRVLHAPAYH